MTHRAPDTGPASENMAPHRLRARPLGLFLPQQQPAVVMRTDCYICRSEGLAARSQVLIQAGEREILASLLHSSGEMIAPGEIGLSESAAAALGVAPGDAVSVRHAPPIDSFGALRGRVYGNRLDGAAFRSIVDDIVAGRYSDVHLSAFVTACSAFPLDHAETVALTGAMVASGERLAWGSDVVVDKHSVGGLPGNRTTPIVVAIVAALGLIMPKTSSRAITSPAGTADTMETLAPVNLDVGAIRRVVDHEGGCIVWGGAVSLSPADDIIIGVERVLDLDAAGQLVASVLSKKLAAGATHLVVDMPIGPTAKVRSPADAAALSGALQKVAAEFGLILKVMQGDGREPIGRGIGPALEARDILAVLEGRDPPPDLARRACELAGALIELAGRASPGTGAVLAAQVLADGSAWSKFQRICEAQGGMRTPPLSNHRHVITAQRPGYVSAIDNRRLAKLAKLAGAPAAKSAGLEMHVRLGSAVETGTPLLTVHAESQGELAYALAYAEAVGPILELSDR